MLGAGTLASPWQVADYDDLKKVGRGYDAGDDATYALGDHYILTADIDASASETENDGDGWEPIGTFTGVFDGAGYTIDALYINRGVSAQALFSRVDGEVKDLVMSAVDITSRGAVQYAAAIASRGNGTIRRCAVISGIVDAGNGWYGGAIMGRGDAGHLVEDCYNLATVVSDTADSRNGGIMGRQESGTIRRCWNAGEVNNPGTGSTGGIVGTSGGTVSDSFYDSDTSGKGGDGGGGTGKTTTEMQDIDTYTDTATVGLTTAWDMTTEALHDGDPATATWFIDDGVDYPRLWFEYEADDGDALTADNLTTGAPTLGEPTIEQEHALDAQALTTGAVTLDESTLAQTHALIADALTTGSPTLGEPTVAEAHVLAADGVTTGTPTLDESTIAQVHALTADALATGAPTLGTPVLADIADEVDNLEAEALTTGAVVVDESTVAQLHILTADGMLTGAVSLGQPTLHDQALVEPRRRIYRRTA